MEKPADVEVFSEIFCFLVVIFMHKNYMFVRKRNKSDISLEYIYFVSIFELVC